MNSGPYLLPVSDLKVSRIRRMKSSFPLKTRWSSAMGVARCSRISQSVVVKLSGPHLNLSASYRESLTSLACAVLLLRAYRRMRQRLLLWSGLCFAGLALNNALLVIDTRFVPETDLSLVRTLPALVGVSLLLYGFIWDADA